MNEIDKTNMTDQTKFRLNEISKIKNYFNQEINQRTVGCRSKFYFNFFSNHRNNKKVTKHNKKHKEKA